MLYQLFSVIAPVLTCAVIGYVWRKQGRPYDTSLVTTLVTNIGTPCLVFFTLIDTKLDADAFGTVVTLLLDRMGYRELTAHDSPATTISANSPGGLTSTKVAIRTFGPSTTISRDIVASLRGSLHQFGASEGIVLGLGPVDGAARAESQVPNVAPITILGPGDLAEHLIRQGVGVGKFSVDVSCFDDVFFRELRNG